MDNNQQLPRVIKEDSQEEEDSAADVIVSKAEEILKNISLYDLIKLSMSQQKPLTVGNSDIQGNNGGLKTLLSNAQTTLAAPVSHPSPQKKDLQGFFKEALELQGLTVNVIPAPDSVRNPDHSRFDSFKTPRSQRERFASSEHNGISS